VDPPVHGSRFAVLSGSRHSDRAGQKAGFARRPNAHALLSAAGDVMLLMAADAVIAAIASSLRDRAMVEA
jgi:hypothetical protein